MGLDKAIKGDSMFGSMAPNPLSPAPLLGVFLSLVLVLSLSYCGFSRR